MDVADILARVGGVGLIGLAAIGSTTAFAWFKGGGAERWGAVVSATAWIGVLAYELGSGDSLPVVPILLLDAIVATAYLALALRYNSLWLGMAMLFQGIALGLHATNLTEVEDPSLFGFNLYALGINLMSLGIILVIAGGTTASIVARGRRRRAPAGAALATT